MVSAFVRLYQDVLDLSMTNYVINLGEGNHSLKEGELSPHFHDYIGVMILNKLSLTFPNGLMNNNVY